MNNIGTAEGFVAGNIEAGLESAHKVYGVYAQTQNQPTKGVKVSSECYGHSGGPDNNLVIDKCGRSLVSKVKGVENVICCNVCTIIRP